MTTSFRSTSAFLGMLGCGIALLAGCSGGSSSSDNDSDAPLDQATARLTGIFQIGTPESESSLVDSGTFALQFDTSDDIVALQIASIQLVGFQQTRTELIDDNSFEIEFSGQAFAPLPTGPNSVSTKSSTSLSSSQKQSLRSAAQSAPKNLPFSLGRSNVGVQQSGEDATIVLRGEIEQQGGDYVVSGTISGTLGEEDFQGEFEGTEIPENSPFISDYSGGFVLAEENEEPTEFTGEAFVEIDRNGLVTFSGEEEGQSANSIQARGVFAFGNNSLGQTQIAQQEEIGGTFAAIGQSTIGSSEIVRLAGFFGQEETQTNTVEPAGFGYILLGEDSQFGINGIFLVSKSGNLPEDGPFFPIR